VKALRLALVFALTLRVLGVQTGGSVEGVAVIAGSSDPVSGAVVELRLSSVADADPLVAAVQSNGRFLFREVPPGRYQLVVSKNGFLSPRVTTLTVTARQQITGLRLELTPTAAVNGRVMDRAGQPMPGVLVQLLKPMFQDGRRTMTVMKSMLTNDLGEYRIFWVTPGSYYVNVLPPSDTPGGGGLNIVMNPTAAPAGRSLWSNQSNVATRPVGSGLPETEAYLPIFFPGTADENAATPVDLEPGAEVRSIDIRVSPVRAWRLRGVVLNGTTRQPASNAQLQLISVAPGSSRVLQANTDPMGLYAFPRVPSGPYVLAASLGGGAALGRLVNLEVRDADIEQNVELQPFLTVAGRVQAPSPGALAVRLRFDYPIPNSPQLNVVPAADGSFTLRNVPPGDYRLYVAPILLPQTLASPSVPVALQNAYVKSMRFGDADLLNSRLRLDRPPEQGIEIQIATDSGSLQGRVVGKGQGVPAATVVLMPEVERRVFRGDLFKVTASDESGQFLIEGVPPGDYRVFAWEKVADRAWQDPSFMRAYEESGQAVRVEVSSQKTVEVILAGGRP
jgi:hypothetical protein